jgi:UDPglucose 6-dehydrogenase
MRVTMVGTGYVGLVSGTCLAEVGHDVICIDVNEAKINMLQSGHSPIFEPGLEGMIKRNVEHERLFFSTDLVSALKDSDVAFIAVGTPEGEDGSADLGYVCAVAKAIGESLENPLTVIVKSTVPVGTCDLVDEIINTELTRREKKFRVPVASNPEFLKEGDAIKDFMKPDRIVIGVSDHTDHDVFQQLYRAFVLDDPGRLLFMDRHSSELTKYGANAMLATRISFMNELSRLCERLGADIDNIRIGMGADPRIGKKFLFAGPGYGGSCFPKDVAALLKTGEKCGVELAVLKAVTQANYQQKEWVSHKIKEHFSDLSGKRIAVWGLAFKPGTDDVRESPAKVIIEKLLGWGAQVCAHDPEAIETFSREMPKGANISYCSSPYEAAKGADAVVLVTEWSEYKRPNWKKMAELMKQKVVFDFRNQYESRQLMELGFHYYCVGRKSTPA